MPAAEVPTRQRILAAALDLFGRRGVEAVSLDEIAREVGVRKQTVLYWFASKDELIDAVLASAVEELSTVIDAALRSARPEPLAQVDAVVTAVFRPAIRQPGVLGLIGEIGRLSDDHAEQLRAMIQPLIDRGVEALEAAMAAGRVRRTDPRLLAALLYATVTGIATEPRVLAAVGWTPGQVGLRQLRAELRAFLSAALMPVGSDEVAIDLDHL
jgi:AcrR family transcriptional regulator